MSQFGTQLQRTTHMFLLAEFTDDSEVAIIPKNSMSTLQGLQQNYHSCEKKNATRKTLEELPI